MVIINFDVQECPQISSDKRVSRTNQRRRQEGIRVSALDRVLRNAHSANANFDIKEFADFSYTHLFKRTKRLLASSYDRLKDFGRYLNGGGDYCAHCREYRQSNAYIDQLLLTPRNSSSHQHPQQPQQQQQQRFSDSFVAKVQSQQQQVQFEDCAVAHASLDEIMPCCGSCRRPKPPEFYCFCEDIPPPRRPQLPPYRNACIQPKRKKKKWWCCKRKRTDNWNQAYCQHCHQRMTRRTPQPPPLQQPPFCLCGQSPSMLQKIKYMISPTSSEDLNGYNTYMNDMQANAPPPGSGCPYCQYRNSPRSRRRSPFENPANAIVNTGGDDEEYEDFDPTTDEDDCCCCCPCRKNFNSSDAQTDACGSQDPKTIDTQTDRRKRTDATKRKCCRCCRNGCGICQRGQAANQPQARTKSARKKQQRNQQFQNTHSCAQYAPEQAYCPCGNKKCLRRPPTSRPCSKCGTRKSPRERDDRRPHTIICKAASTQAQQQQRSFRSQCISPGPCNMVDTTNTDNENDRESDREARKCRGPCNRMQNVMFGHVKTTPLFLDKIFTSPMTGKSYMPLQANDLDLPNPGLDIADEVISISDSTITKRTKKRFLNAVCDSILCDLASKRRNSLSDILQSPDSGYQEQPSRKSWFSFKHRHCFSDKSKSTPINNLLARFAVDNEESPLGGLHNLQLKSGRINLSDYKKEKDGKLSEASRVVRGILEEISTKNEERDSSERQSSGCDLLKRDSLRDILARFGRDPLAQPPGRSKSESILGEITVNGVMSGDSLPSTSAHAQADSLCNPQAQDSYTKLLMALDSLRNSNKDVKDKGGKEAK